MAEFSELRWKSHQVLSQGGNPDTWMFVTETSGTLLTALSVVITLLIRQRKIKMIKLGDKEFHNISVEDFERIMKTVKSDG